MGILAPQPPSSGIPSGSHKTVEPPLFLLQNGHNRSYAGGLFGASKEIVDTKVL